SASARPQCETQPRAPFLSRRCRTARPARPDVAQRSRASDCFLPPSNPAVRQSSVLAWKHLKGKYNKRRNCQSKTFNRKGRKARKAGDWFWILEFLGFYF